MEWSRTMDGYCERLDASYWAEPVNAVTNAAFVLAAVIMWYRCRGLNLVWANVLIGLLTAIGIGSYLFHTHATVWAVIIDVIPIILFALAYLYVANRFFLGWPIWGAILGALAFLPFAAVTVPVFSRIPGFDISAAYWPLPLAFIGYAIYLRRKLPQVSRGLEIAFGILVISLVFRSLDMPVCDTVPLGTHFMWHILNGVLLGWVIEVYRRHMVASGPTPG
ncbi:MAG: ceramidase domain-containing protein [Pseudomonadota bacterium]